MTGKPIFIVGCDRSGTTLLRMMLNQHPHIYISRETDFLATVMDNAGRYGDLRDDASVDALFRDIESVDRFRLLGLDGAEVRRRMLSSPRTMDTILGIPFEMGLEREGKSRWGDKTPRYTPYCDRIAAIFPGAQFVHIVRDGRAVGASLKSVSWFSSDMLTIASHWVRLTTAAEVASRRMPARFSLVHYEDLVRQPEQELQKLCSFLGERFEPEMMNYDEGADEFLRSMKPEAREHHQLIAEKPRPDRIDRWRRVLSRRDIAVFEHVAGEALERFGYERCAEATLVDRARMWLSPRAMRARRAAVRGRPSESKSRG